MAKKQLPQNDNGKSKNECPITRAQFREKAKPLNITIEGKSLIAMVKEFDSGSLGWFTNDKFTVDLDGVPCKVQPSINLVIVHSKEAK